MSSCKPCRSVHRSLVCSTLALALGAVPSLQARASTGGVTSNAAEEVPAPSEGDPEALSAAAVERFQAKEYDAAVDLFEQAYAADPQPNYLFNIGRVYEEKGDLENAVVYYQRFVGQSGVDLESRQAATERLKVLRETLAQMKADEPKDDTPADDGTGQPTDEQTPTTDEGDDAAKRKKTLRITGYALMGAGGVGLILGGVFGGLAQGNANDAKSEPFIDRQAELRDSARTQARVADAMFITGGVLAAAGLVLVLTTLGGKKKAGSDAQATWSPVVGPQQVGVGFSRRF
jgi:tetratricopeptide (TPR) repeat protein